MRRRSKYSCSAAMDIFVTSLLFSRHSLHCAPHPQRRTWPLCMQDSRRPLAPPRWVPQLHPACQMRLALCPDQEALQLEGMPWNAAAAKTIMAVKKQLSYELTQDKLLHYMSEWCGTPKLVQGACCYEDCAVENDIEDVAAKQALRERLENCYLRIPHCIKGTVPESIQERLRLFYSRTSWGNINVFKCGQAAQALAKRGLNVVRMFIGLSSGGVGQSLYSTHLQAMYAIYFAFFDPQIWFNEEEMRKQVEQPNGCIILTGQEAPASGRPCSLALRLSFCCCVFGF